MEGGFFLVQRFDMVNSGTRARGIECSGFDEETQTIRSRLMATDGARFTYTCEMDGDKGSAWFSKGTFENAGDRVTGRWHMPQAEGGAEGYDHTLTRIE
jgi:hypothetical protein